MGCLGLAWICVMDFLGSVLVLVICVMGFLVCIMDSYHIHGSEELSTLPWCCMCHTWCVTPLCCLVTTFWQVNTVQVDMLKIYWCAWVCLLRAVFMCTVSHYCWVGAGCAWFIILRTSSCTEQLKVSRCQSIYREKLSLQESTTGTTGITSISGLLTLTVVTKMFRHVYRSRKSTNDITI